MNTPHAEIGLKRRGPWMDAWIRMRKNKSAVVGLIMLLLIFLVTLTAPLFINYESDVVMIDVPNRLQFPAEGHLLGTDELGRDIMARIVWGGRISLTVGIGAVVVGFLIGTVIGAISGYYSGSITDTIMMRGLDIFMAIPTMLVMVTLVSIMSPTTMNLALAVGISIIPFEARLARAQVLKIKEMEFIEAIRAQGASTFRIIVLHILPNALSPIISAFVMSIAGAIMSISSLSFIGLGVQPPSPEWGSMLSSGQGFIRDVWHVTAFPGLAIVITIIALTLVGDGLRDALDPRMK